MIDRNPDGPSIGRSSPVHHRRYELATKKCCVPSLWLHPKKNGWWVVKDGANVFCLITFFIVNNNMSFTDLFAKYNCVNCHEEINGVRVRCAECADFDICLQVEWHCIHLCLLFWRNFWTSLCDLKLFTVFFPGSWNRISQKWPSLSVYGAYIQ